jgi:hypothetical protein
MLRLESVHGTRILELDGAVIEGAEVRDHSADIEFAIPAEDGKAPRAGRVEICDFPGLSKHTFTVDGAEVVEDGQLDASVESQSAIQTQVTAVKVDGDSVTYVIRATRRQEGAAEDAVPSVVTVERSFRDFDRLDLNVREAPGALAPRCPAVHARTDPRAPLPPHIHPHIHRRRRYRTMSPQVRGTFYGKNAHLLSSMPALPPKQLKLLVDHSSEPFVEQRRYTLDAYARKLVRARFVCHVPLP